MDILFIFLIIVIAGIYFIYQSNMVEKVNLEGEKVSVVDYDRNLFLNKISIKTDSVENVDIRTSKYKKALFLKKGDTIIVNKDGIIYNNEYYMRYKWLFFVS